MSTILGSDDGRGPRHGGNFARLPNGQAIPKLLAVVFLVIAERAIKRLIFFS
jgi:hypothetical protein